MSGNSDSSPISPLDFSPISPVNLSPFSPPDYSKGSDDNNSNDDVIIEVILGIVFFVLLVAFCCLPVYCLRRPKARGSKTETTNKKSDEPVMLRRISKKKDTKKKSDEAAMLERITIEEITNQESDEAAMLERITKEKTTSKESEEISMLGRITKELLEKAIRFSAKEIAASTRNYSTKLGSGGFGDVYKGELPGGVKLAVKVLKSNSLAKKLEEQFIAEVSTIGRTYHINLVRLYGFCFDNDIKALVFEYMENGSLDNFLFNHGKNNIEWEKLYNIAIGAAKGLEYLHHLGRQRIIHYDIKPGNILIDSKFCAKIGDFGLAKLCSKDTTHVTLSGCRGTPGYAAPELWMPFTVTYKCDVYSFGMTLFEIIGRKRNLSVVNSSESQDWFPRKVWEKFDKGELEEFILENKIADKDKHKAKTMAKVALWCVQYLPEARPSMSSVVMVLANEGEIKNPPNPFQYLMKSNNDEPEWIESSLNSTTTASDTTFGDDRICSTPTMKKYGIGFASNP